MHERLLTPHPQSSIRTSALSRTPAYSADSRASRRTSWICEPITEEPLSLEPSPTLNTEQLKRHHRPRAPLPRVNSAPQLISTTTTSPVYIKYPSLLSLSFSPLTSLSMSASLMPRSDSYNARVRGASHIDFKTATTGVAAKAMRNELSALVSTVSDPPTRKVRSSPPPTRL